jgi:quinolinate synthase
VVSGIGARAKNTDVDIILWRGHCIVHERFTPEEIRSFRAAYDGDIEVLAHPECPPEVLEEADYVGSTSGMINHVGATTSSRVLMVTECSMADNVAVENPQVEMIRPCNICPYMNTITLPKILRSLETLEHEVTVDADVAERARRAVERMLEGGRGRGG